LIGCLDLPMSGYSKISNGSASADTPQTCPQNRNARLRSRHSGGVVEFSYSPPSAADRKWHWSIGISLVTTLLPAGVARMLMSETQMTKDHDAGIITDCFRFDTRDNLCMNFSRIRANGNNQL